MDRQRHCVPFHIDGYFWSGLGNLVRGVAGWRGSGAEAGSAAMWAVLVLQRFGLRMLTGLITSMWIYPKIAHTLAGQFPSASSLAVFQHWGSTEGPVRSCTEYMDVAIPVRGTFKITVNSLGAGGVCLPGVCAYPVLM